MDDTLGSFTGFGNYGGGDPTTGYFNSRLERPGVHIHWDRFTSSPTAFYQVVRADSLQGPYAVIATLQFPADAFVDSKGGPSSYYRVKAIAPDETLIAETAPFIGTELLIKSALEFQIDSYLRRPVYDEMALFNRDRTQARWTFNKWSPFPRKPELRITGAGNDGNNDALTTLDETVPLFTTRNGADNYPNGLLYQLDYQGNAFFTDRSGTPAPVDAFDALYASYSVRLFTGSEMNDALNMALQTINCQAGTNKYPVVGTVPFYYDPALVCGASYFLLRRLLSSLSHQELRLLFQDEKGGSELITQLREDVKMYQEDWKEYLKSIPTARYPHTVSIVIPEMMLPGGRSRFFRQAFGHMN